VLLNKLLKAFCLEVVKEVCKDVLIVHDLGHLGLLFLFRLSSVLVELIELVKINLLLVGVEFFNYDVSSKLLLLFLFSRLLILTEGGIVVALLVIRLLLIVEVYLCVVFLDHVLLDLHEGVEHLVGRVLLQR